MGKMLAPISTYVFIKSTGTFSITAPTAAALLADIGSGDAVNISTAVAQGSSFTADASDTVDSRVITDGAVAKSRGYTNYSATLISYIEADPTGNPSSEFLAFKALLGTKGVEGILLRRVGYLYSVAFAAGHECDMGTFVTDNPRIEEGDNGGAYKITVPLSQLGTLKTNTALG